MQFILVTPPNRVQKKPDRSIRLISNGNISENGFKLKTLEIRYYLERTDEKLGPYCLITSYLETEKDSMEMTYDEGYRGIEPLESTVKFLVELLGLSGLILRLTIALKDELSNMNT